MGKGIHRKWDEHGELTEDMFNNFHSYVHRGGFEYLKCVHDEETGELLEITADIFLANSFRPPAHSA